MKPESKIARRRRIAARIEDLESDARMFARWATGYLSEAEALKATLAELEQQLPLTRGKERIHGLPY